MILVLICKHTRYNLFKTMSSVKIHGKYTIVQRQWSLQSLTKKSGAWWKVDDWRLIRIILFLFTESLTTIKMLWVKSPDVWFGSTRCHEIIDQPATKSMTIVILFLSTLWAILSLCYPHRRIWVRLFVCLFDHTELSYFSLQLLDGFRRNFQNWCDYSCRMF